MYKLGTRFIPAFILTLILVSCGGGGGSNESGSKTMGYKDTKSMVMDILKSDDAKKVIQSAAKDEQGQTQAKLLSSGDGIMIQSAVKDVLTQTDQAALIQQIMSDPKFAGDFAKALNTQLKDLHKDLIKDPEYQKSILEVMKNQQFQTLISDAMNGIEHRQQVMSLMQDALQSPLYKTELTNIMKKALEEQAASPKMMQAASKQGQQGGGGKSGGGQGGEQGGGQGGSSKGGEQGGQGGGSQGGDQSGQGGGQSDKKDENKKEKSK